MRAIVIVRYSILTLTGMNSWRVGRTGNGAEYRERLFEPGRLEAHEFLFQHLTLPSLVNQSKALSPDWFRLVVLTSSVLPEPYRRNLDLMLAPHAWARVVTVKPEEPMNACAAVPGIVEEFARGSAEQMVYSTIRLDDDDALTPDFLDCLEAYSRPEFAGFVVSLARGYTAEFDPVTRRFGTFYAEYRPKLALGLAMIHLHKTGKHAGKFDCIYAAGNHTSIDQRLPVILDASRPVFLRTVHRHSDTSRMRDLPGGRTVVETEMVRKRFPLSTELF